MGVEMNEKVYLEEQMVTERQSRIISCAQTGCGVYHPFGHLLVEERLVTPWREISLVPGGGRTGQVRDDPKVGGTD
jgi:hypothetical protein